jgi:hypothetical protein
VTIEHERQLLEARQLALIRQRNQQALDWLDRLTETAEPALLERAIAQLGFRDRTWDGNRLIVIDDDEQIPVTLNADEIAQLVRARSEAGWSYADVRPLIRPGAGRVPARYLPLGFVTGHVGDLPEITIDAMVEPGATIAFEVGQSYREWILDEHLGYLGTPPPDIGAQVWRVLT